jgi:hypothetical protein
MVESSREASIANIPRESDKHPPALLEDRLSRLRCLYEIHNPLVSGFLSENHFLMELLEQAQGKIAQVFGEATPVELRVVCDPEADEDAELFALIKTERQPQEAMELYDTFLDQWWLDALPRGHGKLMIHLEYV